MKEPERFPTLGEICGFDKGTSFRSQLFRLYLELDVRTLEDFRALKVADQFAWLVYQYIEQVGNGGLDQFFSNPSGEFAAETLEALKTIGARREFETLQRAFELFPDSTPSVDQEERQRQMRAITSATGREHAYLDELIKAPAQPSSPDDLSCDADAANAVVDLETARSRLKLVILSYERLAQLVLDYRRESTTSGR